jgi:hypothetical protein
VRELFIHSCYLIMIYHRHCVCCVRSLMRIIAKFWAAIDKCFNIIIVDLPGVFPSFRKMLFFYRLHVPIDIQTRLLCEYSCRSGHRD